MEQAIWDTDGLCVLRMVELYRYFDKNRMARSAAVSGLGYGNISTEHHPG